MKAKCSTARGNHGSRVNWRRRRLSATLCALTLPLLALSGCARGKQQDARLRRVVVRRLAADRDLNGANISVAAANGVVTLSGVTNTNAQRAAAAADANIVGAVTQVVNRIKSLQELQATLQKRLAADSALKGALVQASAGNGRVTLSGQVASAAEKTAAETIARSLLQAVPRVKLVDSISVAAPPPAPPVRVRSRPPARRVARVSAPRYARPVARAVRHNASSAAPAPVPPVTPVAQPEHEASWGFGGPKASASHPIGTQTREVASSGVGQAPPPTAPAPPRPQLVTLPAGTRLEIRLDGALSSASATRGETFRGTLAAPLSVGGNIVVPVEARVTGVVLFAHSAGHFRGRSELRLMLTGLHYNGNRYPMLTTNCDLRSAPRGKNTAESVGIGAVAGGIIGGILGGGKGAVIGAGGGAGAGAAKQALTKPPEVKLPAETELAFRLSAPLRVRPAGAFLGP